MLAFLKGWFESRSATHAVGEYATYGMLFTYPLSLTSTEYRRRFLLDEYESTERAMVVKHVCADDTVWELGASIGVVAAITNRILASPPAARHVVVEANPLLISFLARNMQLNNASLIIEYGVVGDQSVYSFGCNQLTSGHVVESYKSATVENCFLVPGITIDCLLARHSSPSVLIMDIEGAEYEFIDKYMDRLPTVRCVIVEMHTHVGGIKLVETARARLAQMGFEQVESCYDGTNYTDVWRRVLGTT